MYDPIDSRPFVLVRCDRSQTRDHVTTILRKLNVPFHCVAQLGQVSDGLDTGRVRLLIADSAGGLKPTAQMLTDLDSRHTDLDLPVILLADSEARESLIEWTSQRFQTILLPHLVTSERLTLAIEAGLRLTAPSLETPAQPGYRVVADPRLESSGHATSPEVVTADEATPSKNRFWAAVSHEIRTPVNALILGSQLLKAIGQASPNQTISTQDIDELTDALLSNASSLVDLVEDLFEIARHDQREEKPFDSNFALGEWMDQTLAEFYAIAAQKRLGLTVDVTTPNVILRTDRRKLARVVQILVKNAIKFTSSGQVRVSASACPDDGVRLEVEDTGIGIPPRHRETVFDEFAQLENPERDRSKGTGLGLAICRRLVNLMGGTIRVNTDLRPLGTALVVELPPDRVLLARKIMAD